MRNNVLVVVTNVTNGNAKILVKSPNKSFHRQVLINWKSGSKVDAEGLINWKSGSKVDAEGLIIEKGEETTNGQSTGESRPKVLEVKAGDTSTVYDGKLEKITTILFCDSSGNKKLAQIKCKAKHVVKLTITEFGVEKIVEKNSKPTGNSILYKFDDISFDDTALESHNIIKNGAPYLMIEYPNHGKNTNRGNIIVHDINIPEKGLADFTTYCVLMWNEAGDGHGHCGIECRPCGRMSIYFKLYPPTNAIESKIEPPDCDKRTKIEKCGEGNSTIILRRSYDWLEPDRWYTFTVRVWNDSNKHSCFGFWVTDLTKNSTTHIATFDYPVYISLEGKTCSFMEAINDTRDDHHREVILRNGYKFCKDGKWKKLSKAVINYNKNNNHPRQLYDVEIESNEIRLLSGGDVRRKYFRQSVYLPMEDKVNYRSDFFIELNNLGNCDIQWILADKIQFSYLITSGDGKLIQEKIADFESDSYNVPEAYAEEDEEIDGDEIVDGQIYNTYTTGEIGTVTVTIENIFGDRQYGNIRL